MMDRFTPEMLTRITTVLDEAKASMRAVPVYAEAEKVRRDCAETNIALEDIVERFISDGQRFGVAFEIDPAHARSAVMGD